MSNEYPESFARFYDVIYHHQRDHVDLDYFLNQIRRQKGRILEAGAGTGRLFTAALNQGADIYGLDISQSMIRVLKEKLKPEQRNRVSLQNLIDFRYNFKFDLVVAPFRVIMHLLDKNDQLIAINNVYRHLERNGRFIFDVFIPDLNQLLHGIDHVTDFHGEYEPGKKLKRIVTTRPDLIHQTIHITFRLEWDEDGLERSEEWDLPLRYFFRYELEHLVERSDFKNYKIFGDYQGKELDANSSDFIVVCEKL